MVLPLRQRLLAAIGLPVLAICVLILGLTFVRLAAGERADTVRQLAVEAAVAAERFDAAFRRAATAAMGNARAIEADPFMPEDRIDGLLAATVGEIAEIHGAAMAFEPGTYRPGAGLFAPYAFRTGDGRVATMNIDESVYDWYADPTWTWWHEPKRQGRGVWTAPYFDAGAGNVAMVTYAEPFQGSDGRFRGVATVDVALETLASEFAGPLAGERDFIIVGAEGRLVASRREGVALGTRLADLGREPGWESLRDLDAAIAGGRPGTGRISLPDIPGPQLVGFAPIGNTGWSFAFRVPEREVLAPVRRRVLELTGGLILTLATIVAVVWFMAGRLVRPVLRLRDGVAAVAAGDLDVRVEGVERRDEIGQLAEDFNRMTGTLSETLTRLTAEQADRARIERDLDLAREIQRGLLPRVGLTLDGFTVAGWNQPADKTGGDYYDWLPLPDGRAIVTLADVTGHGIGPAMIVSACRAYMRASAGDVRASLGDTLTRVNHLLHQDVGEGRFVTAAVGLIDPGSGTMDLISAGQAPILFVRGATGEVDVWPADTVPLGILDPFPETPARTIEFAPGDQLVLVTDGFFEWANASRELFGFDRLSESVARHRGESPSELIRRLHADVLAFAGGTPQTDDLTALIIRRD
jgi:sigma-B regulation protein RsbU (phosphoserine phosphatase)